MGSDSVVRLRLQLTMRNLRAEPDTESRGFRSFGDVIAAADVWCFAILYKCVCLTEKNLNDEPIVSISLISKTSAV
jgi:hypothetical protein